MKISTGEEIKKQRKKQGLTQKDLAKKAGIAEITLRKYEAESIPLKADTLSKIAAALNLNEYYFYGFSTKFEAELFQALESRDIKKLESLASLPEGSILQVLDSSEEDEVLNRAFTSSLKFDELALLESYSRLNQNGQIEALTRVEELTQIPKYKKENEPGK